MNMLMLEIGKCGRFGNVECLRRGCIRSGWHDLIAQTKMAVLVVSSFRLAAFNLPTHFCGLRRSNESRRRTI